MCSRGAAALPFHGSPDISTRLLESGPEPRQKYIPAHLSLSVTQFNVVLLSYPRFTILQTCHTSTVQHTTNKSVLNDQDDARRIRDLFAFDMFLIGFQSEEVRSFTTRLTLLLAIALLAGRGWQPRGSETNSA
jgi:hypothetical protein